MNRVHKKTRAPTNMPDSNAGDHVKLPLISAVHRGPGPAKYVLPSLCSHVGHDVSKTRNPSHSFGVRHKHALTADSSPGPRYLQKEGVDRYGPDGSFKFSMGGAARYSQFTRQPVPGPG